MNEVVALADEETRALWEGLALGYTESLGLPLLRQEIAGLYDGMEAEDVITAAPQELILIAMNCLLEAGDHVVCTFPGYQSLYQLALALGCEVTRWQPDEDRDWRFDVEALRAAVRPATRLIVVNFPHNPTGTLPDRDTFDEVVAIARGCGAYLFSDEMYRMLELDPTRRLPSACEAYEKALSLSGMSKVYGMAGTRIGWLATPDRDVHRRLAAFKDYTTICSGAPSEVLALIGLRASDRIVAANLKTVRGNLAALTEFLGRHTGLFSWVPPEGGTICLPRLHDADGAPAGAPRPGAGDGLRPARRRADRRDDRPVDRVRLRRRSRAGGAGARQPADGLGAPRGAPGAAVGRARGGRKAAGYRLTRRRRRPRCAARRAPPL
jgi:aspartate/methionine/tyrosine aminotransferase